MSAENKTPKKPARLNTRPSLTISALTVIVFLFVVNFFASMINLRIDLTEENLYTLSDGTKQILRDLDEEITIKYFFSKSLANLPRQYMGLKTFGQKTLELLQEYKSLSSNVTLQLIDPEPDSELEEDATKYGLRGAPLPTQEKFYMGIVFLFAGNERVIPFVDPTRVQYLEYDITRTIDEVTKGDMPKLGIISSLPVFEVASSPFMPQAGPPQPGWMFVKELEKTYKVENIEATAEKIPEGLDCLLVIHPKDFSDKLLFAIDQFVVGGGNLIAMVDPYCRSDESAPPSGQQFAMPEKSSDLNKLLKKWGVEVPADEIAASKDLGKTVNAGPQGSITLPTWMGFEGGRGLNTELVLTNQLDMLMFVEPGYIKDKKLDGITVTPLITAAGETSTMKPMDLSFGYAENARKLSWKTEDRMIAALVKGKFKSAFDAKPEGSPIANQVKEAVADNSIIVIADVDMLYDDYWVNAMNFFGYKLLRPTSDNFNLLANSAEFLAGSEALISIRSRGKFERPFTRIKELQTMAEYKWRAKEEELLSKLKSAEEKVNQLTGAKVEDGRIILSKEQEEEVRKFRDEQVKVRKELRLVRRDLRRDVVDMGTRLTILNTAFIPIIVAFFGFWFIRNRC